MCKDLQNVLLERLYFSQFCFTTFTSCCPIDTRKTSRTLKRKLKSHQKKKGTKVVSCTQANRKGFSESPACGESFQKLCCMTPKYFFFFPFFVFLKGCFTLIHEDKLQQLLLAKFARISKEV